MYPRSSFDSGEEFVLQWKGVVINTGEFNMFSTWGAPANGTISARADEIELPGLPTTEHEAMLDIQASLNMPERLGYHVGHPLENFFTPHSDRQSAIDLTTENQEPFWGRTEHPCTWGGRHIGMAPGCCLRENDDGGIESATVVSLWISMYDEVYRGDREPSNFRGAIPNSIGNLQSLRKFGIGASHISGTLPTSLMTNLALEVFMVKSTLVNGVLPEPVPRSLYQIWVTGNKYLSGTLPASIGAVESLRALIFTQTPLISGTMPSTVGHSELQTETYRDNYGMSGTIPTAVHPDHWSASLESGSFNPCCTAMHMYSWQKISGTLPSERYCNSNASSISFVNLFAAMHNKLSGTVPSCAFDGMPVLEFNYLQHNRLSGTIPSMRNSSQLHTFKVDENDFSALPTFLPPSMRQFFSHSNPPMHAPADELGRLLLEHPHMNDYSFQADDSVAHSYAFSIQQGNIPDMAFSVMTPAVPLDCRIGEPCTFTINVLIGLNYFPVNSIGVNFDLRLDPNFIELDEYTMGMHDDIFRADSVSNISDSQLGRRRRQQVVDQSILDEAVHVLEEGTANGGDSSMAFGGHQTSVSDSVQNLSVIVPILDNWDGTYTAKLDFSSANEYYELTAIDRINLGGEALQPTDFVFTSPGRYGFRVFCNEQLIHFHESSNWHVNMHPISCLDPLAFPDESGVRCRCPAGFAPAARCEIGQRDCQCLSCTQQFGERHRSADGAACVQCPKGEVADEHGIHCQCAPGRYNHTAIGVVTCVDQEFKKDAFETEVAYQAQYFQFAEHHSALDNHADVAPTACITCPTKCLDCLATPHQVKPGFHLANSMPQGGVDCTIVGVQTKCLSVLRCRPEDHNSVEHQCLGGDLVPRSLTCNKGYHGQLCGTCSSGYGREDGDKCVNCEDANDPVQILKIAVIITIVALAVGLGLVYVRHHHAEARRKVNHNDGGKGQPLLSSGANTSVFSNPLDEDGTSSTISSALADHSNRPASIDNKNKEDLDDDTTNSAASTLGSVFDGAFFVSLQPIKIVVTYLQIASMLGAILHFKLPKYLSMALGAFKPLIAAINGIIALQCVGIDDFYLGWIIEVFIIPVVAFLFIFIYYMYERKVLDSSLAKANVVDRMFFLLFIAYPPITNKLFSMLNCRVVSNTEHILVADYEVDCDNSRHFFYATLSQILIVLFSGGVPFAIMVIMYRDRVAQSKQFKTPQWLYITRQVAAEFAHDDVNEIRQCIIDIKLGNVYGFLIKAFKPGAFFWECLDMLRKLLLVGLLTIVDRGSTLQVCVGMLTCLFFIVAHIAFLPFRYYEDNVLKASTEIHLFMMLMTILALKGGVAGEWLRENDYDIVLTVLFLLFVPGVMVVAIGHKWINSERIAMRAVSSSFEDKRASSDALFRRLDIDDDGRLTKAEIKNGLAKIRAATGMELKLKQIWDSAEVDGDQFIDADEFFAYMGAKIYARQHETGDLIGAFNRFRLGRDFVTDREILDKCFARIESEVNDSYHIMISYRVASEKEFALELYEILSKQVLTATGQRLRVFLDQVCLKDGERWGES
jgi:Ca2+-binding EF-hand superfamily protein